MHILFVDGIGGAELWRRSLLKRLNEGGHHASCFSYCSFLHGFEHVKAQLADTIRNVSASGAYAIVGYSFGGVLARAALLSLQSSCQMPRHLFLLGSPVRSSKLGKAFRNCLAYRLLTGDCGQVAASPRRMREVGLPSLPTTCMVGTKGMRAFTRFMAAHTANDGMVSASESCPHWFEDQVAFQVSHPFLPQCPQVSSVILERLARPSTRL